MSKRPTHLTVSPLVSAVTGGVCSGHLHPTTHVLCVFTIYLKSFDKHNDFDAQVSYIESVVRIVPADFIGDEWLRLTAT